MGNSYFQFKEFRIDQEDCAMKVCTDACIFGAWFAARIAGYTSPEDVTLDIGCGTGLLMLMLAQTTKGHIDGIEIGGSCYSQLSKNLANSPWSNRLQAIHGDVRSYGALHKYKFIIVNPPFYENDLSSTHEGKQLAMHSRELKLEELVKAILHNLAPGGTVGILLPFRRAINFEELAVNSGLFKTDELKVKQSPKHPWFRSMAMYCLSKPGEIRYSELIIKDEMAQYTPAFVELLKPYYLHL
jgi:tRNA1Val (adenine37-N6)-methyltransferase